MQHLRQPAPQPSLTSLGSSSPCTIQTPSMRNVPSKVETWSFVHRHRARGRTRQNHLSMFASHSLDWCMISIAWLSWLASTWVSSRCRACRVAVCACKMYSLCFCTCILFLSTTKSTRNNKRSKRRRAVHLDLHVPMHALRSTALTRAVCADVTRMTSFAEHELSVGNVTPPCSQSPLAAPAHVHAATRTAAAS